MAQITSILTLISQRFHDVYTVLNKLEQVGRYSQPSPVNSPVFGVDGEIIDMIHRAGDVTEFVRPTENELQRVIEDLHTRTEEMEVFDDSL